VAPGVQKVDREAAPVVRRSVMAGPSVELIAVVQVAVVLIAVVLIEAVVLVHDSGFRAEPLVVTATAMPKATGMIAMTVPDRVNGIFGKTKTAVLQGSQ
jgi:hypothetical protein